MTTEKLGPCWYAAGTVIAVPFCAVMIVAMALMMLALWPVWPYVAHKQRKDEIEKLNINKIST